MSSQPPVASGRTTWLIMFSALAASVGFYALLCYFLQQTPRPRQPTSGLMLLRPIVIGLGVVALAAAVAWLRFTIDGKIGGQGREVKLSPGQFLTQSIIALALAETCSIFGLLLFFLGAPLSEFALFAAGTLLVDFAFILPRGLQFWANTEG